MKFLVKCDYQMIKDNQVSKHKAARRFRAADSPMACAAFSIWLANQTDGLIIAISNLSCVIDHSRSRSEQD